MRKLLITALFGLAVFSMSAQAIAQEVITRPNDLLNRAEAVTAVIRSKEQFAPQVVWFSDNLPEIPLFSDVDQNAWYAPFIEVGFLEGIIKGHVDGTFKPADSILTEHAIIMMERVQNREIHADLGLGRPITRGEFLSLLNVIKKDRGTGTFVYRKNEPQIQITETTEKPKKDVSYEKLFGQLPSLVPFSDSTPLVLTIPPKEKSPQSKPSHEFASEKTFAITIPSLEINDVPVIHPIDPFSQKGILEPLKDGLGHLFAYPGSPGKIMIYGHSSGYPWDISEYTKIFRKINELKSGERIFITHDDRMYIYEVNRKQIISAKDVAPFNDDGTTELILYTCWPPDSIKERYLVHAFPVEIVALK